MKLNDNTSVAMPIRNLLSIIIAVAFGVWAYFGVIARLTQVETSLILTEKDLEKNTEFRIKWPRGEMGTLPADSEQYMLIEFMSEQVEAMQTEMESMMSNTVNINFLKDQVSKLQGDVEKLKDKVRQNGNY
jgi:TolA-binding protein|tara:strand:+ start:22 stop:414 length:393 start_codon:yes stop_codon:yes gene_type:complete